MSTFLPFPHFKRPNPETINWNQTMTWQLQSNPWQEQPWISPRYYRAFTSVDTPGFRSKKRGKLPVNPYSLVRIKTEDGMGCDTRKNSPPYPPSESETYAPASYWASVPSAPLHNAVAYDMALRHLIDRNDLGLDGNIAQDLAQVGQTVRQIGDSASRIARSLIHVKHLRFDKAWKVLATPTTKSRGLGYRTADQSRFGASPYKSLAENWLALQYGWKPLLQDIDASMRSLANVMVQDPNVVRTVRGKGKFFAKSSTELGLTSRRYQKTGNTYTSQYDWCTIGLRYTIDNRLKQFLAQTGFTNPINLAWEVLPYSFVIDWFYPIGPYLTTLSAFDGLSFVDGFVSKLTKRYYLSEEDYVGPFPAYVPESVHWIKRHRYWQEYLLVDRIKLFSFPGAVQPQLKNPFSVTHALNALSLLRAAFK